MKFLEDLKAQYQFGGIVQKLIFWNIGLFLVSIILFFNFRSQQFTFPNYVALHSSFEVFKFNFWTVFTYMFFHNGFLHLLFNMLMLHFSSRFFLTFFTEKQFLFVYLAGGIFSGFVFLGFYSALELSIPLVGASASIMAILVSATLYQPNYILQIPLIGKLKLWYITAVLVALDLVFLVQILFSAQMSYSSIGGRISHLAGAFFGLIFVFFLQKGIDFSSYFTNKKKNKNKTPFKKVYKNKANVTLSATHENQKRIDDILDKISTSGYDNLTKEEKEFLFKQGK